VICTPVEQIVQSASDAASHVSSGAILTDAGSTKGNVVMQAENAVSMIAQETGRKIAFVGSHPLAGSEKTGPDAARADLFQDRVVVITPTAHTDRSAAQTVSEFWEQLGASVVRRGAEEHDQAMAMTSHLPHLIATVLAAATPEELTNLTAGGWRDTTRIAAGDPELWRQIFLSNQSYTLKALADFETVLARFRTALEAADGSLLASLLAEGKRRRDAVGN
jgi:prephenate dehydrogenase